MRFEKWHALGNAYLLVEQPDAGELSEARVRRLCDVDTGIGSDGLLEVTGRDAARASVRIWNPDGSTAELSGNGTRIAAAWMLRESGLQEVEIETESKLVRAAPGALDLVRQELGAVSVGDDEVLDVAGERLGIVPVDAGNPHAVVRRETLSRDDLLRLGPAIETHSRFPGRTNVQLAALPDEHGDRVRGRGRGLRARLGARRGGDGCLRLVGRRGRGCRSRARLVLEPRARGDAGWRAGRHDHGWGRDARRAGRAHLRRHHRPLKLRRRARTRATRRSG